MTAGVKRIHGLFIRGLSLSGSTAPLLFTDGELDATTLPSTAPGLSTSMQIEERIFPGSVPPFKATFSLRDPVGTAGTVTCRLQDDQEGTLSAVFSPDPGEVYTDTWTIEDSSALAAADDGFTLVGPTAPTPGQVLYLGREAFQVPEDPSDITTSGNRHTLASVTRAACGAKALAHWTRPEDTTITELAALRVASRMDFDTYEYDAAIYRFRMTEENEKAVSSCERAWLGRIQVRPTHDAVSNQWTVSVVHLVKVVAEHAFQFGKDRELKNVITVLQVRPRVDASEPAAVNFQNIGDIVGEIASRLLPQRVAIPVTVPELERFSLFALHRPESTTTAAGTVTAFNTALAVDPKVEQQIVGEVGGHTFVWRVLEVDINRADIDREGTARAICELKHHSAGASISDNPKRWAAADGFQVARDEHLNDGFTYAATDTRVRFSQQEKPPKLSWRVFIDDTWVGTFLRWALSGRGDGANSADWDVLPGGGLQFDEDWLLMGTAGTPLTDDEGTTELLKLGPMGRAGEYYFGDGIEGASRLGEWLKNELMVHCSVMAPDPSSGRLTARRLARKAGVRTSLNQLAGAANIIKTGNRLRDLRIVYLERGVDPVSLEFRYRKPLHREDAKLRDAKDAVTLKLWNRGGAGADDEIATGDLARLTRYLLGTALGSPPIWDVPVTCEAGIIFGDLPKLTDGTLPTPAGRGVTDLGVMVESIVSQPNGIDVVHVLEDIVNNAADAHGTAGNVGGRLKIVQVDAAISSTRFVCRVVSVDADTSFRIDTSHGGVWASIAAATGRVRVQNPRYHNPVAANEEPGPLTASATVNRVSYDEGTRVSRIDISVDATWARGGFALLDIVQEGARVLLAKYTPASLNPEGVALQPHSSQGPGGVDILAWGQAARKPRHDGHKSLIGS